MRGSELLDLATLRSRTTLCVDYPDSFVAADGAALWLERAGSHKRLAVASPPEHPLQARFAGSQQPLMSSYTLKLCPIDASNALVLRETLPWMRPIPLGLVTSAGFGDRLGLATPGHVRALHKVLLKGGTDQAIAPIFAQQSIREMTRSGRTPGDVLADATWGAFEAGWRGCVGADADHLKSTADVDETVSAGYTLYTLDPSAHVDDEADRATPQSLIRKLERLPWSDLECNLVELRHMYAGKKIDLEHCDVTISDQALTRAATKYGAAIAHVSRLYRHLASKSVPFEVEISVDETETPTSLAEHIYFVSELRRLGVRWVSLAPRYVGRFEKGVDFIGDREELRTNLFDHAAVARALGPYKLSLHSGSDKFSVYPIMQEATRGLVHLKTAGTSYLEALRVTALLDPTLFRAILALAREHYARDRATYIVSADLARVPEPNNTQLPRVGPQSRDPLRTPADDELGDLLDQFDTRQVLHVTFGSVLAAYRAPLLELLRAHENAYSDALERHFMPHLAPFVPTLGPLGIGQPSDTKGS